MDLSELLSFRKMITPNVIQAIFGIGTTLCVIAALITIGSGMSSNGAGAEVLLGFGILVFGPVLIRMWCELVILQFKIHEALEDIRNTLVGREIQSVRAVGA